MIAEISEQRELLQHLDRLLDQVELEQMNTHRSDGHSFTASAPLPDWLLESVAGTLTDLGITTVAPRHEGNWMGPRRRVELGAATPAINWLDALFDAEAAVLVELRGAVEDDVDEPYESPYLSQQTQSTSERVERVALRRPEEEWTWGRLRKEVRERGIPGRSGMSKPQLRAALGLPPEAADNS
ncbi:MAG: hypothetical protein ACHQ0J_15385 [Candidatus Dormibacterales bacterium]